MTTTTCTCPACDRTLPLEMFPLLCKYVRSLRCATCRTKGNLSR